MYTTSCKLMENGSANTSRPYCREVSVYASSWKLMDTGLSSQQQQTVRLAGLGVHFRCEPLRENGAVNNSVCM